MIRTLWEFYDFINIFRLLQTCYSIKKKKKNDILVLHSLLFPQTFQFMSLIIIISIIFFNVKYIITYGIIPVFELEK